MNCQECGSTQVMYREKRDTAVKEINSGGGHCAWKAVDLDPRHCEELPIQSVEHFDAVSEFAVHADRPDAIWDFDSTVHIAPGQCFPDPDQLCRVCLPHATEHQAANANGRYPCLNVASGACGSSYRASSSC